MPYKETPPSCSYKYTIVIQLILVLVDRSTEVVSTTRVMATTTTTKSKWRLRRTYAIESFTPMSTSNRGGLGGANVKHMYTAVPIHENKVEVLVKLIEAIIVSNESENTACPPVCICCNTKDVLDVIVSSLQEREFAFITFLHADQTWAERIDILDQFQTHCYNYWSGKAEDNSFHILITTEFCTPGSFHDERSLQHLKLLINYDLPAKKEMLSKRVKGFLNLSLSGKVVAPLLNGEENESPINATSLYFVLSDDTLELKSIEGFSGVQIPELISLSDIL